MKSFFKKVALVLALVMVVTMLPARVASAAEEDLQMRKYMKLYIDGDYTGTYGNTANAWVKYDKEAYTVAFTSSDEEVATVGPRKGGVTAVGVGRATITATFTNKSTGEAVTKECVVDVKRNAVSVALKNSQKKELEEVGIEVGETYQTAVSRLDADSNKTWKQVKVTDEKKTWVEGATTSGIRFSSDNEDVFTVGPNKGLITAVGEGTATLSIWAVQSEKPEKDEDGKNVYQRVTEIATYEVKVIPAKISVEQSAYNAFEVTFPSEEIAKAAKEETEKSLSVADAAVTEKEDIIKVYKVIKNAAGEEKDRVAKFIQGVSVKSNSEKQVISVTMFEELDQEAEYVILYKDYAEVPVITAKNIAADIELYIAGREVIQKGQSKVTIGCKLLTKGTNGQDVVIGTVEGTDDKGTCKDYTGWQRNLTLEDLNSSKQNTEYMFDAETRMIWFYTDDNTYFVNIKGIFADWYVTTGKNAPTYMDYLTVPANNESELNIELTNWCVAPENGRWWWIDWSKKEFATEDLSKKLVVELTLTSNGVSKEYSDNMEGHITFVSSNEDKLIVGEADGMLYPPKDPKDGIVNILVYYDGRYVGSCPVQVWAKRNLDHIDVSLTRTKLSVNNDPASGLHSGTTLKIVPYDQLGDEFYGGIDGYVEYDAVIQAGNSNYLSASTRPDPDVKNVWYYEVNSTLPTKAITTFRVLCTAKWYDNEGHLLKTAQEVKVFTAKNTTDGIVNYYNFEGDANVTLDTVINNAESWGDYYNEPDDKKVTIVAYSYDRDGFEIERIDGSHANLQVTSSGQTVSNRKENGNYTIVIQYEGVDYISTNAWDVKHGGNLVRNGSNIYFDAVDTAATTMQIVSGSSEIATVDQLDHDLLLKAENGKYGVYLYVGNGSKSILRASKVITVKDSQPIPTWTWTKYNSENQIAVSQKDSNLAAYTDSLLNVIEDVLTFNRYDYNGSWHYYNDQYNIYVGAVKETSEGDKVYYDYDFVIKGTSLSIKQVRSMLLLYDGTKSYYFEVEIPVGRSVTFGGTK